MSVDFDPRDVDTRHRGDSIRDREDELIVLGRGTGSPNVRDDGVGYEPRDRDEEWREERDRETRHRDERGSLDPSDVFIRDLDLPNGRERELIHDRVRDYTLSGSDTRTLSTIGAFRVVAERDLDDPRDATFDGRGDLRHLEKQGLIERVPLDARDRAAVLTMRGRTLLEAHRRDRCGDRRQAFHAGADRARERTHDAQLYRAYLKEAERLREQDARILRVQLDRELKRDYQRFLQERNRGDRDSDGRPDRSREEIEEWAREHDLPYYDNQVHFPDVRIEYEDLDGDVRHRDIEVTTEHYRGGHASSVSRSGFVIYCGGSRGGGGSAFDPRVAEEFLAMLETCCRPGEILSLQWQDVDLETRELTIRAEKAKTRRARRLPISSRLLAVLEMRRLDPAGKPFPSDAYVFGDRLGRRIKSIRTAWENARDAAGLERFQLRDLRHEAASRFEEAGVLTTDVSKFLGHRNLSTTTRYLNTTSRRLRLALMRVEQARAQSASLANSCKETPDDSSHADDAEASSTPSKSLVS